MTFRALCRFVRRSLTTLVVLCAVALGTPAAAQEEGTWTGTTSQGLPYEMDVVSGTIVQVVVGYSLCGGALAGTATIPTTTPVTVGGGFNVNGIDTCPSVSVSGTINTSTTASGTVHLSSSYIPYVCGCTASATPSWSAEAPGFTLHASPSTTAVCAGEDATYTVDIGSVGGYTDAVSLTLSGDPAGSTVDFSPDPVTPSGSSNLTVGTGSVTPGSYELTITGTSGSRVKTDSVDLIVSGEPPTGPPTLATPATGSTVPPAPLYTWTEIPNALAYDIEVAADDGFSNVVHSASGLGTASYTGPMLAVGETFHWHVRATNACGASDFSGASSFTTASLAVIYDNGSIVSCAGCGSGGADASELQSSLGMTTFGFANAAPDDRAADDFTVPAGERWHVDAAGFLAYQTNAPTDATPITGLSYRIWDGPPNVGGSTAVFGDTSANRLAASSFAGTYRVGEAAVSDTSRAVWSDTASGGVILEAGTYWIDWQTSGSPSYDGPWVPPLTTSGETTTGNALLDAGDAWAEAVDSGALTPQGFPFVLYGTIEFIVHQLSVSLAGPGSGTVTSSPEGIDCGSTCSAGFPAGETVTLGATPAGGSTFEGWSGACTGTGDCQVTMDADASVTATFFTPDIFADDFESGDTTAWSAVAP